jgi:hypothetical protein
MNKLLNIKEEDLERECFDCGNPSGYKVLYLDDNGSKSKQMHL